MTWTYTNYELAFALAPIGLGLLLAALAVIYAPPHTRVGRWPISAGYALAVAGTVACLASLAVAP